MKKRIIATSLSLLLFSHISLAHNIEMAEQALKDNDIEKAKAISKTLIEQTPQDPQLQYLMAKIEIEAKDYDNAEEYLEKAIELAPKNDEYYYLAGTLAGIQAQESSIFTKLSYAGDVKDYFHQALKLNPNHRNAIIGLIQYHLIAPGIAGGDEDEIPALIEQLESIDPVMAVSMQAQTLMNDDKVEQAEKLYDDAIEQNPNSLRLHFIRGIYTIQKEGYAEALHDLKQVIGLQIENDTDDEKLNMQRMALYQIGKASGLSGLETGLALQSLYQYLDLDKKDRTVPEAWIRYRLGQVLFHQKQPAYAIAQFDLIKDLEPEERLSDELAEFKEKNNL